MSWLHMLPILTQSLWRDEAFSVLIAQKDIFEIFKLSAQDTSPPLYYVLLHYWIILFGDSEVAIRTMSLIFHLLLVTVIFFIAKKLIRSFSGQMLIALTTFFNPFLIQYAFEARAYSLVTFLSVTAIYLIMLKKNLMAGIFLALAIFSHNFAILTFVIFAIWWLFINRTKFQFSSFLKLVSFPLLMVMLSAGAIWIQWSKFTHGFWISKPTASTLINSFEIFSSGEFAYPIKFTLYLFSIILAAFAGFYWIRKDKIDNKHNVLLILLLIFIPILAVFIFSLFFTPLYYERYLILTAPLLILFIGYSLKKLLQVNSAARIILSGFIVIYLTILVIASMQIVSKSTKADIASSIREILSLARKHDVIIPKNALNFLEIKYYVKKSGKNIPVYAYSPDGTIPFYIGGILYDARDIIREMPKNKRVWQITTDGRYELLNL